MDRDAPLEDAFLTHVVASASQYDPTCRRLAAQVLADRREIAALRSVRDAIMKVGIARRTRRWHASAEDPIPVGIEMAERDEAKAIEEIKVLADEFGEGSSRKEGER